MPRLKLRRSRPRLPRPKRLHRSSSPRFRARVIAACPQVTRRHRHVAGARCQDSAGSFPVVATSSTPTKTLASATAFTPGPPVDWMKRIGLALDPDGRAALDRNRILGLDAGLEHDGEILDNGIADAVGISAGGTGDGAAAGWRCAAFVLGVSGRRSSGINEKAGAEQQQAAAGNRPRQVPPRRSWHTRKLFSSEGPPRAQGRAQAPQFGTVRQC